jgi:hypothetical protein
MRPLRKGLYREEEEVDHVEGGYKNKKSQFQNYKTPFPSSQIAKINFNSPFLA